MSISEQSPNSESLLSLKPTQEQLKDLSDLVLSYEPETHPSDDMPKDVALANMVDDALHSINDERLTPSSVLRAPDRRIIWLTTFRNPDNNQISSQHISVKDPPVNLESRDEIPEENYLIHPPVDNYDIAIESDAAHLVNQFDVDDLKKLIESSEPFNPFD